MAITVTNTDAGLTGNTLLTEEGAFTITGLYTFDRDPSAPFAVAANSAVVTNLDADKLDGNEATAFARVGVVGTWTADQTFNDNVKLTLGTGGDADIYYNGSNLILQPDVVGSGGVVITGTTPRLTIGDGGAEDTSLVFDGNAQDFYIGLDDTTDDLLIGVGSAVGGTPALSIDENQVVTVDQVPVLPAGAGTATFGGAGVIDIDDTQAALASGAEAVLRSYTVPANTLNANGRAIRITAYGTFAADTDAKTARIRWGGLTGGVVASTTGAQADQTTWRLEGIISRIGANSQRLVGWGTTEDSGDGTISKGAIELTTDTENETGTIALVVTGAGVNASDVVYQFSMIEMLN